MPPVRPRSPGAGHCQTAGEPSRTEGQTEQRWRGTQAQERSTMPSLWASVSSPVKYGDLRVPFTWPHSELLSGLHWSQRPPEYPSSPAHLTSSCPSTISSKKPPMSPGRSGGLFLPSRSPVPPCAISPVKCAPGHDQDGAGTHNSQSSTKVYGSQ